MGRFGKGSSYTIKVRASPVRPLQKTPPLNLPTWHVRDAICCGAMYLPISAKSKDVVHVEVLPSTALDSPTGIPKAWADMPEGLAGYKECSWNWICHQGVWKWTTCSLFGNL